MTRDWHSPSSQVGLCFSKSAVVFKQEDRCAGLALILHACTRAGKSFSSALFLNEQRKRRSRTFGRGCGDPGIRLSWHVTTGWSENPALPEQPGPVSGSPMYRLERFKVLHLVWAEQQGADVATRR